MQFLIASIYLVAFWDFFVRWVPAPPALQAVLSQLPEMVVYAGILVAQFQRLNATGRIRVIGRGIDGALFIFIGWTLFSTLLVMPDGMFIPILNIKALVRYVFVFYLVATIEWNEPRYSMVRRAFYNIFLIQMVIGALQIVIGQPAIEFFSPRSLEGVFGIDRIAFADRDRSSIEVFGTFRNTISFAYLIMIGAILVLISQKKLGALPVTFTVVLALAMLLFSGSRIVLFFLLVFVFLNWSRLEVSWKRTKKWLIAMPILIVSAALVYMYVLSMNLQIEQGSTAYVFSPDYLEGAMNQRLGIITQVLPEMLFRSEILLGLGADKEAIADYLNEILNVPNVALLVTLSKTLEDVYWVTIVLYFGIPGFVLFLVLWFKIYGAVARIVQSETGWISEAAIIAKILLLASVPLNLVNQAFEVQVFALTLWTFAAIAIKASGPQMAPRQTALLKLGASRPRRPLKDGPEVR